MSVSVDIWLDHLRNAVHDVVSTKGSNGVGKSVLRGVGYFCSVMFALVGLVALAKADVGTAIVSGILAALLFPPFWKVASAKTAGRPADAPAGIEAPSDAVGASRRSGALGWVFAGLFLALAVMLVSRGFVAAGGMMLLGGAFAVPPLWSAIAARGYVVPWPLRAIGGFGAVILAGVTMPSAGPSSGGAQEQVAEVDPVAEKLATLKAKLGPDAVMPMDEKNYPKKLALLGRKRFDEANALTEWAALAAAESDQCPKVDMIGISDSTTRDALKWYVDCSNKERFMIDEEQAVAARDQYDPAATPEARSKAEQVAVAQPKSARWADFNEANTVSACDLTVQNAMLVPRSFSTGLNRWAIDKNDETGVVTIERDYKAENAYGMKINGRYRCVVDTNAAKITALSIREPDGWRKLI